MYLTCQLLGGSLRPLRGDSLFDSLRLRKRLTNCGRQRPALNSASVFDGFDPRRCELIIPCLSVEANPATRTETREPW